MRRSLNEIRDAADRARRAAETKLLNFQAMKEQAEAGLVAVAPELAEAEKLTAEEERVLAEERRKLMADIEAHERAIVEAANVPYTKGFRSAEIRLLGREIAWSGTRSVFQKGLLLDPLTAGDPGFAAVWNAIFEANTLRRRVDEYGDLEHVAALDHADCLREQAIEKRARLLAGLDPAGLD